MLREFLSVNLKLSLKMNTLRVEAAFSWYELAYEKLEESCSQVVFAI